LSPGAGRSSAPPFDARGQAFTDGLWIAGGVLVRRFGTSMVGRPVRVTHALGATVPARRAVAGSGHPHEGPGVPSPVVGLGWEPLTFDLKKSWPIPGQPLLGSTPSRLPKTLSRGVTEQGSSSCLTRSEPPSVRPHNRRLYQQGQAVILEVPNASGRVDTSIVRIVMPASPSIPSSLRPSEQWFSARRAEAMAGLRGLSRHAGTGRLAPR
jgi:hypothetical protein